MIYITCTSALLAGFVCLIKKNGGGQLVFGRPFLLYRRISQRWVIFQPQPSAQRWAAPLAARRPAPRRWHLCAAGAGEAIAAAPTTRRWLGPRGAGNQLPIATSAATLLSCDAVPKGGNSDQAWEFRQQGSRAFFSGGVCRRCV